MSTQLKRFSSDERTVLAIPVYEALKERILDQVVAPGDRLNIDALAAELNVSPTPVREALARLGAERLVSFTPFKGYTVSPLLTPRELADLMYVRRLLETDAARQAAVRIGLLDLRALARILADMDSEQPQPRFREYRLFSHLDQKFHELLVAAADNKVLLETYQSLNIHVQAARYFHERGAVGVGDSMVEHHAIVEALRTHDPETAAHAVSLHIDNAYMRAVEPTFVSPGIG
jgi:DNA-binding GntR family transcriptional regulator